MNNLMTQYTPIKYLSDDDRPREKLIVKGRNSLSNAEIIGILIGSGTRSKSAIELSRDILDTVGNNLDKLARLTIHDLMKFKGIGTAKAVTIAAALELGRRKQNISKTKDFKISDSIDIYNCVGKKFHDLDHEEFYIILLNRANKVIAIELISVGGFSGTFVDGKKIFKKALEQSASAIVLCHNHPSGTLVPSQQDVNLTKRIVSFASMIQINIIDHVIFAGGSYFSFKDEGILLD